MNLLAQALMGSMPGQAPGATPPTWQGPGMNEMHGALNQADSMDDLANALMSRGYQGGGWADVIGNVMGALHAKKTRGKAQELRGNTLKQLDAYGANQSLREAAIAKQRALHEANQKKLERQQKLEDEKRIYQRGRDDKREDAAMQLANQKAFAQFSAGLKPTPQPDQPSVGDLEAMYLQQMAKTDPEQYNTIMNDRLNKQTGGGPDELQTLVDQGHITPEQAKERRVQKALGTEPSTKDQQIAQYKTELSSSLDYLDSLLEKHGTELFGQDAKQMETVYTDILLKAKEAYNLGVLSGPDLALMESVLNDPTSFGSAINPWATGNIRSQIKEMKKIFSDGTPQAGGGRSEADIMSQYGL